MKHTKSDSDSKRQDKSGRYTNSDIWVTEFSVDDAIYLQEQILEQIYSNPQKPVVINISSNGGEVDGLTMMLDAIDAARSQYNTKIITVATGKAMSAGAVLLSHGDIRFATKSSRIMLHQVISGAWGPVQDINVEHAEINRLNENLLTTLYKNCKFKGSKKAFTKLLERDLYLDPKQSKELGIIDLIGYPKVVEHVQYELMVLNGDNPAELLERDNEKVRRTNKSTTKKKSED